MNKKLFGILDRFKGKKVLVIGDIMLDKYIWGDVSRISPEAPVQVVNVLKESFSPGGASNVAANIASLNGSSYMVGIAGNDSAKGLLIKDMNGLGINTGGIVTDNDKPTTQKVRIIGKGQQLLRVDYEKKEHVHSDIEKSIIEFIVKMSDDADAIIISDYAKGVITKNVSDRLVMLSREKNMPLIIDPKPKHAEFYKGATIITPNNSEACEMTGMEDGTDETVMAMGKKLMEKLDSNVLITRGEKGMSLFEKGKDVMHLPTNAREVYSLIGAGDTVVATLALALSCGADFHEASYLANIAAGIKVGKIGTASVTVEEIKQELEKL